MIKLQKYKNHILIALATLTFLFGMTGFYLSENSTGLEVLNHTLGLYVMEWVDHEDSWVLDLATLFGALTFFLTIIKLFFSKVFQKWRHYSVQKRGYTIILGLSEQNISLLKSNEKHLSTVIIEKDNLSPEEQEKLNYRMKRAKRRGVIKEIKYYLISACLTMVLFYSLFKIFS